MSTLIKNDKQERERVVDVVNISWYCIKQTNSPCARHITSAKSVTVTKGGAVVAAVVLELFFLDSCCNVMLDVIWSHHIMNDDVEGQQALFIIIIWHGIINHTFEFLLEPVIAATGNLFQSSIRSANRHQIQWISLTLWPSLWYIIQQYLRMRSSKGSQVRRWAVSSSALSYRVNSRMSSEKASQWRQYRTTVPGVLNMGMLMPIIRFVSMHKSSMLFRLGWKDDYCRGDRQG